MSQPRGSIVGASIAGAVLTRGLSKQGIKAALYERETAQNISRRSNYGISLHLRSYQRLLRMLNMTKGAFRRAVAVKQPWGNGSLVRGDTLRANRNKFEQLLRRDLDAELECKMVSLRPSANTQLSLQFASGKEVASEIVFGAYGPHSHVLQHLVPEEEANVAPYVA